MGSIPITRSNFLAAFQKAPQGAFGILPPPMNITVNEALKAYIDPLTPDEHAALERSILAEGCRDALVFWGDLLIDGHNRYGICQKHGLPFQTVQNTRFQSMEDVHLWMIDQHLGRRSVSDFQRGVLALRKRAILAERRSQAIAATASADTAAPVEPGHPPKNGDAPEANPLKSRADIAKVARLSNSQVVQIEKIQKQAAPEVVAAVKSGVISINAAAAVASLPAEEQKSAALGGKDELKQAAKRVRDGTRKTPPDNQPSGQAGNADADPPELQALQAQIDALTTENQALRAQLAHLQAQLAV